MRVNFIRSFIRSTISLQFSFDKQTTKRTHIYKGIDWGWSKMGTNKNSNMNTHLDTHTKIVVHISIQSLFNDISIGVHSHRQSKIRSSASLSCITLFVVWVWRSVIFSLIFGWFCVADSLPTSSLRYTLRSFSWSFVVVFTRFLVHFLYILVFYALVIFFLSRIAILIFTYSIHHKHAHIHNSTIHHSPPPLVLSYFHVCVCVYAQNTTHRA